MLGACTEKPKDAARWSTRALAKRFSPGKSTVNNILRERGIKPRSEETKKYLEGKANRFVPHFIPAHSSRLNMVERRFGELANKRIRRESN
jgi:hypothetical protein